MYDECEGPEDVKCEGEPRWIYDPYTLELYNDKVEIFVCEAHEDARYVAI